MTLLDENGQGHLFDPDDYGPGRKPRAARVEPVQPPIEPLAPGYTYVRDRKGVIPYAHLIAGFHDLGVVTLCGRVGTKITNAGVEVMRRCPLCDAAQQLQ